jgi:DNA-binding response OmpR family regulator
MNSDYLKILFIEEDETDFLDTVMALANEASCEVVHVQSNQEALLCLDREAYDIVLLNLPDHHGLQTIENLHRRSADTAILILADFDDEEQVIAAVGQGAQGCLVKGHFDGATLNEYIRYAIGQHQFHLARG